ncbi:uncharacterized protein LOC108926025 [Arapaima gigas]
MSVREPIKAKIQIEKREAEMKKSTTMDGNESDKEDDNVSVMSEKLERMVEGNGGGCYTNQMFHEVEAAIRIEQERLMEQQGPAVGGEAELADGETKLGKKRKCSLKNAGPVCQLVDRDLEKKAKVRKQDLERRKDTVEDSAEQGERSGGSSWNQLKDWGERWEEWGEMGGEKRKMSRKGSFHSALNKFRKEAILSEKVLKKVKVIVAAGFTGVAVGAMFGAAAPLAAAAGATVVGNVVGLGAGQLAGASVAGGLGVGKAVGAIASAAAAKSTVAIGAVTGVVLGGSVGALAGADAETPGEAAVEALEQVAIMGAAAVGVAAGVGGALGAATAIGAIVEGPAVGCAGVLAPEAPGGAAEVVGSVGTVGADGTIGTNVMAGSGAVARNLENAGAVARLVTGVMDIGRAAAGIALAGSLVVKVVKERVRQRTSSSNDSSSEKTSYEIYWNKQ